MMVRGKLNYLIEDQKSDGPDGPNFRFREPDYRA